VLARIIDVFLRGRLAPLLILLSLLAGVFALAVTPREEEPQIVVPMADVHVTAPGLSVEEVERQVATRVEKLLAQIDGVEHVYSMSLPGSAIVTVRFFVGEDREDSLVKIYNKLFSNTDRIPPSVSAWVVKPVEIDDVPILIASLWSAAPELVDDHALRRVAEELEIELQAVPGTNRVEVVGGRPRHVRVELDPNALAARQTSALEVAWALGVSNDRRSAGGFDQVDAFTVVDAGDFFEGAEALRKVVVNVVDGVPVFLEDVAAIRDGPAEREGYTWIGFGPAEHDPSLAARSSFLPAVHLAVAKQKGKNAVDVANRVARRIEALAPALLPEGVQVRITRNYGETANQKVNELLEALAVALLIVIALIAYSLGWREGLVVAVTVPVTFALTLLLNHWAGYTINRVTLFALILSLGLVVDDPIVDVENIYRHLRMRAEPPLEHLAQPPHHERRLPGRGHRQLQRPAPDPGRQLERAQLGVVGHVDPHAGGPGVVEHLPVDRAVVRCGEHQREPAGLPGLVVPRLVRDRPAPRQLGQRLDRLWRHHGHPRPLGQQPLHLAQGHAAAAHHQAASVLQAEHYRVHGASRRLLGPIAQKLKLFLASFRGPATDGGRPVIPWAAGGAA